MTTMKPVADHKAELRRQIEIADRVLLKKRWSGWSGWNWIRDYEWVERERARLARELAAAEADISS